MNPSSQSPRYFYNVLLISNQECCPAISKRRVCDSIVRTQTSVRKWRGSHWHAQSYNWLTRTPPPFSRLFSEWCEQHEISASSCSSSGPPSPSYSQSSSPLLDSFTPVPHSEAPGMEAPLDAVEHTPERTPLPPSVSTAPNSPSEPPAACRRLEML